MYVIHVHVHVCNTYNCYIFVSSAVLCDPVGRGLTARVWRCKKQTTLFHQPKPLPAKNLVYPLSTKKYMLQNQRNISDIKREIYVTKSGVVRQEASKTPSPAKLSVRKEVSEPTLRQGYK